MKRIFLQIFSNHYDLTHISNQLITNTLASGGQILPGIFIIESEASETHQEHKFWRTGSASSTGSNSDVQAMYWRCRGWLRQGMPTLDCRSWIIWGMGLSI